MSAAPSADRAAANTPAVALRGGDILARQLIEDGVTHVFGVPGVQLDVAVDALAQARSALRFISARHEQGAAYMADGYARATGQVGVCMVVPGPGVLNAAAGLATAYACSSPVLCLAAQIPSRMVGRGIGLLHEITDQTGILARLTKWQAFPRTAQDIGACVHAAIQEAQSGRPRPVAVELAPDVLAGPAVGGIVTRPRSRTRLEPDQAQLELAAELLSRATSPIIYAGGGVCAAGAWEELQALAEHLQLPVVMSLHGRDALDDRHPLAVTSLAGRDLLQAADLVLVLGSRFRDARGLPVRTAPGTRRIFVNVDDQGTPPNAAETLIVRADAKLALAALRELTGAPRGRSAWSAAIAAARAHAQQQLSGLEPQLSWVRALRAGVPEDGILVNELTQIGYACRVAYPVYGPRTYITPGYLGTLGYGLATAIGAKAGAPQTPVISISGDGGLGWTLPELATAKQYGLGVVCVVFNDGAYGNVRRTQLAEFDGRTLGTDLVNPDFASLAAAYGIRFARVRSPGALTSVLHDVSACDEPVLIEVPVSEMPSPWGLILDHPPTSPAS